MKQQLSLHGAHLPTPSRERTPRGCRRGCPPRPRTRGSCTSGSRVADWSLLVRVPANLSLSPGYYHLGGIIKADKPGAMEGVHYNVSPHRIRGTLITVARRVGAK